MTVIPFPSSRLKQTLLLSVDLETLKNEIERATTREEMEPLIEKISNWTMNPDAYSELTGLYFEKLSRVGLREVEECQG